jgi:hypothetical protein
MADDLHKAHNKLVAKNVRKTLLRADEMVKKLKDQDTQR